MCNSLKIWRLSELRIFEKFFSQNLIVQFFLKNMMEKSYLCKNFSIGSRCFYGWKTNRKKMQTIIIVPCYNEAKRLNCNAFADFVEENADVAFLFVNDGSKDNTIEVLNSLSERNRRLMVLDLKQNGGKAEAVRNGMLYACNNLDAKYIGFWDADLATPLYEIPRFVAIAEQKDFEIVTGLRLMRLGAGVRRKKKRHYLGRCFATAASVMLDLPVYDTQCGAKLYRSGVVKPLFSEKFVTRWLFDVELLARYIVNFGKKRATGNIYEHPVFAWEDVAGSRLKFHDFFKAPLEMLRIKRKYLRKKHIKP